MGVKAFMFIWGGFTGCKALSAYCVNIKTSGLPWTV